MKELTNVSSYVVYEAGLKIFNSMIHISSFANVCVSRHEDLGKKYYSLDPEKKRKKDKKIDCN